MENNINHGFDKRDKIINELLQGLESFKKLQNQITTNNTSLSINDYDYDNQALNYSSLIDIMMSTFNKTISIAKQIDDDNNKKINNNNVNLEFSKSNVDDSPRSDNSQPNHSLRAPKRRKTMSKWTKTVTVEVGPNKTVSGLEGPLDDGFCWRKYGQKEILGAKFPRGYYRCTHRPTKGCTAKKQVQQSDTDPTVYHVIYRAEHTCNIGPQLNKAQINPTSAHPIITKPKPHPSPISEPIMQEIFMGLGPKGDLQFEVEPNELNNKAQIFRCYSFRTSLLEVEPLDNCILSWSHDFASPTTSDSNYFPTLSYEISGTHAGLSVKTSESDIIDPISGQNSVTNSPTMGDFEFPREQWLDLDPNFF